MRDAIILIFANKQDLPEGNFINALILADQYIIIFFFFVLKKKPKLFNSNETTRNTRKTWSNTDPRSKLVRSTILCDIRWWTLRRPNMVNIQSQIMRIDPFKIVQIFCFFFHSFFVVTFMLSPFIFVINLRIMRFTFLQYCPVHSRLDTFIFIFLFHLQNQLKSTSKTYFLVLLLCLTM